MRGRQNAKGQLNGLQTETATLEGYISWRLLLYPCMCMVCFTHYERGQCRVHRVCTVEKLSSSRTRTAAGPSIRGTSTKMNNHQMLETVQHHDLVFMQCTGGNPW